MREEWQEQGSDEKVRRRQKRDHCEKRSVGAPGKTVVWEGTWAEDKELRSHDENRVREGR